MFPCPKSGRIDQAEQLLLCYSSGESQAVYFTAGLWGKVVIILSRNMHWKAKSLHTAQQEKHSTIRGHHCCMQRKAETICCSWKMDVCCSLWAVRSRCSLCGVHPSVCSNGLHSSGKSFSRLCLSSTWASALRLTRDCCIRILFIKPACDLDLPLVPVVFR